MAGVHLATAKALVWDFGIKGTGGSLLFVIAPLMGVIEGVSKVAQEFIIKGARTEFEKQFLNYTIGAFWNKESAIKYQKSIDQWNKAGTIWEKLKTIPGFAARAYSAGLYGTYTADDLGGFKADGTRVTANDIGKLKVGSFGEVKLTPRGFLSQVDNTSLAFAAIVATTACYIGLSTRGGAEGVGLATTKAVVISMVMILISDYFLSAMLVAVGIG